MRKFIGVLIAFGAAPILAFVPLLPVTADVSVAGGNACAPQSLNPHPTDPGGSTTAALFCTTPSPTPTASGGTRGNNGSGNSGSRASRAGGTGGTASSGGGAETTLASTTSGSTTPEESMRFNWASNDTTGFNASGSAQRSATKGQLSDGLLAFFSDRRAHVPLQLARAPGSRRHRRDGGGLDPPRAQSPVVGAHVASHVSSKTLTIVVARLAIAGQRRSCWPANASWMTVPISAIPIPAPTPATRYASHSLARWTCR